MDKFQIYEKLRKQLSATNCLVDQFKNIEYGIQFYVYYKKSKELVRIFEGKKKGTTLDLSQVRDEELRFKIENLDIENQDNASFAELNLEDELMGIYSKLKLKIEETILEIIDLKKINYGVQIKILFPRKRYETIRIYKSNKKGLTLDLSLVESEANYDVLDELYRQSYLEYLESKAKKNNSIVNVPSKKTTSKKKRKKKKKKDSEHRKAVKESMAQKPLLDTVADNIIHYVKANGISVMRYDSKISESIYLKFDFGAAGSLRISAHDSKKTNLKYTFNIIKGLSKPHVETVYATNGQECKMYFYPFELSGNVAIDILRYKEYKLMKYGKIKYDEIKDKYKSLVGVRAGFWSKAVEI